MPDGVTHEEFRRLDAYWVYPVFAISGAVSSIILKNYLPLIVMGSIFLHYRMGRYINPDLDQVGKTKSEGYVKKDFGKLAGRAFEIYWTIYMACMNILASIFGIAHPLYGAHRTWLTHKVFPGTLIRLAFFDAPIVIPWYMFFDLPATWIYPLIAFVVGQFIAFAIVDWRHIKLDEDKRYAGRTNIRRNTTRGRNSRAGSLRRR